MAKFASKDEPGFNPIQDKVLSGLLLAAVEENRQQDNQFSNERRAKVEPIYLTSAVKDSANLAYSPDLAADESLRFDPVSALGPQTARTESQINCDGPRRKAGEKLSRTVKCLLSPSEDRMVRSMVVRLSDEAEISLTLSFLMRACLDLLLHCEDQLKDEFARSRLERPYNEKTAITDFERQLAEILHAGVRKARPLRYR